MSKNKRVWRKHYDSLPIEEAIKQLNDFISSIDKNSNNSLLLDLKAQRDEYKRRANNHL